MNTQSLTRTYWTYTIPSVAALMVNGLYSVVDGIFIGQAMGAEGLAALNLAWPLAGLLWAVGMLIGMGGGAELSIARGAGDLRRQGVTMVMTGLLLVVLGLVSGAAVLGLARPFLLAQGGVEPQVSHGLAYLRVEGWTAPLMLAGMVLPLILRNLGAPRLSTVAMLGGAGFNVLFDWILVIRLDWGLAGAAIATALAQAIVSLFCLVVMARMGSFDLWVRPALREGLARARAITVTGTSSAVMALYVSFVFVLHNMLFLKYGSPVTVAAYAVSGYVMSFFYYFAEGVAGGMQPLASYFHGARDRMKIARVLRLALWTGVGGGATLTLLVVVFPTAVARVFGGSDAALIAETAHGLRLQLWAMFLDGFIILAATWFQSTGRARTATGITLANMGVQLPFLFVLPLILGVDGVWLAMPLSNVALAMGVAWLLWRAHRGVFARAAVLARRALADAQPVVPAQV
ncbi:MAG: polysaccharide biosynthesis C-terminal domain-containing protein [Tabrizicola sp.]|nr:polysaccharide biosynthesis C-terminal domain-containing protein [Tabrizicola sp.]